MNVNKLLVAVVALQGLILASVWTGHGPVTAAYGQIPDAGSQRQAIVDEIKVLNVKMDKLMELLKSGEIQVKVPRADEKK